MHHKSTKNLGYKATKVGKDFTSEKLTCYSGITVINDYLIPFLYKKQFEIYNCNYL